MLCFQGSLFLPRLKQPDYLITLFRSCQELFYLFFFEALLLALLPAAFASLFRAAVFAAVVRIIYAFLITVKHFFHFFYFIFFAAYSYYISLSVSLYLVYLG